MSNNLKEAESDKMDRLIPKEEKNKRDFDDLAAELESSVFNPLEASRRS